MFNNETDKEYMSQAKHRNPKAYANYKRPVTDYSSKKKCAYGDKQRGCDAGCKFWYSCIKGAKLNE